MQKAIDDLDKALSCIAEAGKQVEMAILHLRPSVKETDMSKDEIALRQRCSGFAYALLASMSTADRVMSADMAGLLALVPDPEPGPDGNVPVM